MTETIFKETVEAVLLRIKWKYDEFLKNPNYIADIQRPYETIDDWLNEYTGEMVEQNECDDDFYGEYWSEETYGDILPDIIQRVIEFEPPVSVYSGKNNVSEYFALEIESVIRDLPITRLGGESE